MPTPAVHDNFRGMVWALIAVITASAMTIAIRGAAAEMDSNMIAMARFSITVMLAIIAMCLLPSLRKQLRFSQPWRHVLRGILVGFSTLLGFYSITQIDLATVSVLFFTAPIFATVLSVLFFKEQIGPRRIIAIALGFLGAIIILRPGVELNSGMIAALVSSLMFAGVLVMSRGLADADGPFSTFFSANVMTVIVTVPFVWSDPALPSQTATWAWVIALVLLGIVRQFADILTYRYGDAAVVAPFAYLRLVILGIAGYLMFDETPDRFTLIGATVIIVSTFYITQRERKAMRTKP
ncbi:DMT transporter permease [Amylibacter ulvae]|uniref:DMT transporter permease n=1 Tax=Paramylibacter ulvae TaxID=1651968 RepID=A0ABQ3CVL9_9RHOB|nr:DMT family transporter [Amylibacter ulvae]GHA44520.1 DMT transporter permease [Amylibacter ulvae]